MITTLPAWVNLEFLVIESNPQYVADPNTGEIVVQPGWFQITTPEQLADVEQQIQALTPAPPPTADWVGFFQSVREQWNALTSLTTANTATLVILIARMPVTDPTSLQILATEWNECVNGLPADHGIDFAAVAARAIAYHCDLFATINPITGRFPV